MVMRLSPRDEIVILTVFASTIVYLDQFLGCLLLPAIGQRVDKERTGLLSSASMVCTYLRVSTHSNVTNSLQSFVTPQIPSLSTVRCPGSRYPVLELIAFVISRVFPCLHLLVHARYTGTGHADLTKWEWATHQHRDTLSSIVGHPALTSFVALADNESIGRVKFEMTEVRLSSVGCCVCCHD